MYTSFEYSTLYNITSNVVIPSIRRNVSYLDCIFFLNQSLFILFFKDAYFGILVYKTILRTQPHQSQQVSMKKDTEKERDEHDDGPHRLNRF